MKRLIVSILVLAGLYAMVYKTDFFSYVRTAGSLAHKEVADAVPTSFELKRVRQEIEQLDSDASQLIKPMAELKAGLVRLQKEIDQQSANLAEQKESLLERTRDLELPRSSFVYSGKSYTAEQVRTSVQRDFESYQRQEKNLASMRKLHEAKQTALEATREQWNKVHAKRREFELRLAQLEADEETLKVARMGARAPLDDRRPGEIERSLQEIERRLQIQRFELEMAQGTNPTPAIVTTRPEVSGDLKSIQEYLSGGGQ